MRKQADDACLVLARERTELFDLIERKAELRGGAAGLDLVVMAAADAEVDAQMQLVPAEQFAPVQQRMQRIEGDVHADLERARVFLARREIRREQDSLRRQ